MSGLSKWDFRFLEQARLVATWSKDPAGGVGCLLVSPDKRQVSWGYNGFPAGIPDNYEGLNREAKNRLTLHAEDNALANAPCSVHGWTLYTTKAPCFECSKRIIQNRIALVVRPPITDLSTWFLDQREGSKLLMQAGVRQLVDGKDQA